MANSESIQPLTESADTESANPERRRIQVEGVVQGGCWAGNNTVDLMLPYTPLHYHLLHHSSAHPLMIQLTTCAPSPPFRK
ncbi:MAG: hypothetical protein AAF702_43835 [Chloroflexota bacterium]